MPDKAHFKDSHMLYVLLTLYIFRSTRLSVCSVLFEGHNNLGINQYTCLSEGWVIKIDYISDTETEQHL